MFPEMRKDSPLCEKNTEHKTESARGIQEGSLEEVPHEPVFMPIRISISCKYPPLTTVAQPVGVYVSLKTRSLDGGSPGLEQPTEWWSWAGSFSLLALPSLECGICPHSCKMTGPILSFRFAIREGRRGE